MSTLEQEIFFEDKIISETNILQFKFIGSYKKNTTVNSKKIQELLDNCFNQTTNNYDIVKNVSWLRTIFKDLDESYLEITIDSITDNFEEIVIYENKVLNKYQKKIYNQLALDYDLSKKPNLTISMDHLNGYNNYKLKMEVLNEMMQRCYQLSEIKPVELTSYDIALCIVYKAFYNEYPDFSSKDANIKMQILLSILDEFGICTIENYSFNLNSKKIPISTNLYQDVYKLKPLGQITQVDNTVRIDYEVERTIKIISRAIKSYIPENENELEFLKKLSKILYCSRNCLPTHAAIESIAEVCEYPIEEINSTIKLIKKIERKKI